MRKTGSATKSEMTYLSRRKNQVLTSNVQAVVVTTHRDTLALGAGLTINIVDKAD